MPGLSRLVSLLPCARRLQNTTVCKVYLQVCALLDQQVLFKGVRAVKQPSSMLLIPSHHTACCVATVLQVLRRLTTPAAGHSMRQTLSSTYGIPSLPMHVSGDLLHAPHLKRRLRDAQPHKLEPRLCEGRCSAPAAYGFVPSTCPE
jgi:hypothetical protein